MVVHAGCCCAGCGLCVRYPQNSSAIVSSEVLRLSASARNGRSCRGDVRKLRAMFQILVSGFLGSNEVQKVLQRRVESLSKWRIMLFCKRLASRRSVALCVRLARRSDRRRRARRRSYSPSTAPWVVGSFMEHVDCFLTSVRECTNSSSLVMSASWPSMLNRNTPQFVLSTYETEADEPKP